jgi:hypothetical protein
VVPDHPGKRKFDIPHFNVKKKKAEHGGLNLSSQL